MASTLVEFFDKSPLENVVSILAIKPRKVVYLGWNIKVMQLEIDRYRALLEGKGITVEIEYRCIMKNDLTQIQEVLAHIAEENPGCVIDLTGGDELSLVAVGMMAHVLKEREITFHRLNLNTGNAIEFFGTETRNDIIEPTLSVAENMLLYGGKVIFQNEKPGRTHEWDWTDEFTKDIHMLWNIAREDCLKWNVQIGQLERFISPATREVHCPYGNPDPFGLPIRSWNRKLFNSLKNANIISNLKMNSDAFSFTVKDTQIGRVLSKAGTILELKTYLMAKNLQGKNKPYFSDVMTGVFVDWDGKIHTKIDEIRDTENEIDVVCMKGLRPLFISCKNGQVDETELYKLNSVAQRYGGEYAKKALVATFLNKKPQQLDYFRQRAQDMGICLIDNVETLNDKDFEKRLKMLLP